MTAPDQQTPYTLESFAPQPRPPRRRNTAVIVFSILGALAIIIATVAVTLSVTGSGKKPVVPAAATTPAPIVVRGVIALNLPAFIWNPGGCAGKDGYDDIAKGGGVTITDANGTVVGVGAIDEMTPQMSGDGSYVLACNAYFTVENVPAGKGFYGVEVTHRGSVKFDEATVASGLVKLTLG
jgi:hypothetical protein